LGRSQETIFALIRAKKLQYAPKTIGVREKTICQDSLIALLRDLLPPWVDPLDWVDDRLECQEPLVALHETAARLGISERQAPRYLHEHRAWFIKASDGSNIRTSPFWLDAIDETAKPLRLRHIAQLYGQSLNAASFWRLAGLINCPIINHDHSNSPLLFRQCWIALLLANCSPGFEPHIPYFLNRQFGAKPIEMIGIMEVKKVLSASYETVNRLALEGKIWAIKSPEGRWRFPRPYIERSKKLLKG
jgi:hypothetical protein